MEESKVKEEVQKHLKNTLWAMVLTYGVFTFGFLSLLFGEFPKWSLSFMGIPVLFFSIYSFFRNHALRRIDFAGSDYPYSWRMNFEKKEVLFFKIYTSICTFGLIFWAILWRFSS